MFIIKGTSKESYIKSQLNGKLRDKIISFAKKDYFIIQSSGLDCNINRKLETFILDIEKNIEKVYN